MILIVVQNLLLRCAKHSLPSLAATAGCWLTVGRGGGV
jgi:hypothetical protein